MRKWVIILALIIVPVALAQYNVQTLNSTAFMSLQTKHNYQTYFNITLVTNVISASIDNAPSGARADFNLCQDVSGGRTWVWPGTFTGTSSITVSTTALACTQASFITPDGTNWNNAGAGASGGISTTLGFGPLAFVCSNCNANVQYGFAVTCNNLSQTITTGANDTPFVASDVTKIIVGNDAFGHAANCPPQGTITAFGGAHSVTVSNAATVTTTTGSLAWGSQDDGPNLRNAFLASLGKGCLYLPAGNMFAGAPGSDGVNLFIDNRANTASGFAPCVIGQGTTNITPLPTFNYANCFLNDACGYRFAQVNNSLPNYGFIKDWEILGINGMTLTGTGTTNFWINWQRTTLRNVWVWNTGAGIGNAFAGAGPSSAFSPIAFQSGGTACAATGSGGTSAGMNQIITIEQGYCQGVNQSFSVGTNAAVKTKGMQFGTPLNSGPNVTVAGVWDSWGDGISNGFGNSDTIRIVAATGFANLNGDWVIAPGGNTLGALDCNTSGGTLNFQNTNIDGGAAGVAVRSVAGCNLRNNGNNKLVQGTLSISGNNFSAVSETQTGSCTANAATVTFKGTYIAAPLVLVSDSTSASTGAQVTATNATTATIHCNGASDTFTATVIPNPI